MADRVQKIREEVEKLFNHVKDSNFESDSGAFYYLKDLLDFIESLQEEPCNSCQGFNDKDKCDELVFTHNCPIVKNPVSIWHDASEMPDKEKKILTIGYNDETYVSYFNSVNPRLIKQWAYIDDLLNFTTKEEPVSEELESAAKAYSAYDRGDDTEVGYDINRYEGFIAGAEWADKSTPKWKYICTFQSFTDNDIFIEDNCLRWGNRVIALNELKKLPKEE